MLWRACSSMVVGGDEKKKARPLGGMRFNGRLALSWSTVRACLYGMIRDSMVW